MDYFALQIFTNKCSKGGCKQKEMIRVTCDQCHLNYCLKHRHALDHDCKTDAKPVSKSGLVWCFGGRTDECLRGSGQIMTVGFVL